MAKKTGLDDLRGKFRGKDIISLDQFSTKDLQILFTKTRKLKNIILRSGSLDLLKGNIVTLLFFEPSTRTFSSFSASIKRLGGSTIEISDPMHTSSVVKGESLSDMIKTLSSYSDCLIIRHPIKGSLQIAAQASDKPVINAGDGVGEHPTQALLDLFTIQENIGRLNNLVGLIAGDMLNGRTVHSLIRGLSKFNNNKIFLLSPKELKLHRDEFDLLTKQGIKLIEINSTKDVPKNADFWYWTRVQKERFSNLRSYNRVKNKFILKPPLIKKFAGKNTIFMHPLPRVSEISVEVDEDPRALYLSEQLKNGMFVRMALLSLVLGK
ncbi:MAG: Aspartate carbamoyltransferase [Candidatus Levybacteria bacterium GW2011_GWA2_40_8]|nr:MAG: Aspartate carbamoyltransferase [Candidatus Levybacteria bacterium GW2011_GWA2_40_8]